MRKLLFINIFISLISIQLFSQEVVLEMDVEEQYQDEKGPNTRHYGSMYGGVAAIIDYDESTGAMINAWKSSQLVFGYRYKLKLLSFYALGIDFNYRLDQYFLEGDELNPIDVRNPLTLTTGEKKHLLNNNGLGLEVFQRFNIGRRGNSLGKYFDTGIRGQWNFAVVEDITTNYDDAQYVGRERLINRRLKYIESFSYGLSGRIGNNHLVLYSYYRLSDFFKEEFDMPELPRLTVGLQYAF